jgi:hypothetical protein
MSFGKMDFLTKLIGALSTQSFHLDTFLATYARSHTPDQLDLEARLVGKQEGSITVDSNEVFQELLEELWKTVVKPVFLALKLQASK